MQQSSKSKSRQTVKSTKTQEFTPSQLIQKQLTGQIFEDAHPKIKIVEFQNLADFSSQPVSSVPIDEPLFDPLPPIIQFTDYEPLQIKERIFRLRNKDRVARRVKIYKPDSRLFQVVPQGTNGKDAGTGTKVAPGMETNFIIRFSPESKSDYNYDIIVETEREKFVVPIVAVGKRAMIDFPDSLDFGNCPVKYATEKPVIIRNLGEKTTKWFLNLPIGFDADKKEGVLEYGKNEQIVVKFFPTEARTYKNKAVLNYDNMEAYVPIGGVAHNGNVYLSKSQINMTEAFIGLQLQQTLQIINKSNVKVDFEWRAFATEKEEQEKKNRLRYQLEEEEAEERMLIKELVSNEGVHEELELDEDEDSEEEERDEKAIILKKQKKAELMLGRKYRNIRKAIEDDLLLFQDDIFTIEPIQGQIWPNSEMTVTVTFVPKSAFLYQTVSYCNISCSEERLPLNLYGQGMGPRAFLSVYEVNLGDVFVNEVHKTEVVIENRGEIECKFELMPNERAFGKMFKFDVERGILSVGSRMPFTITFKSSIPGEFKETFRWKLEGSTDQLTILFIGHVIAPTFNFDVEKINFQTVSYSFQQRQVIRMTNTSTVAFTFELKIPGDGKLAEREFEIEPRKDSIQPKQVKEISLIFIPKQIKTYEMVMVVDIEGVGQDMLSIPITADCQAPRVELRPSDRLNFNKEDQKVFLRNPCKTRIDLINTSDLPAKFQVLPQNDEYKVLADYLVDPQSGEIKKNSTISLEVTLTTKKLQDITLPLQVNIVGTNNGQPHVITIVAFSEGPKVKTSKTEIDFGGVEVLRDYSQKLTLTNDSDIEADFHAFTKNKVSIFKPIQKHGIIRPKESCEIEILCSADDAVKVNDVLHFVIKEGDDVEVQLRAKGTGSTLFCKDKLDAINMGVNYTYRKVTKEIFVENKGRKPQKLEWTLKKPQQQQQQQQQKKEEDPKKAATPVPEEEPVFSVAPSVTTLLPKHGIMFQFRGYSQKKGQIPETYILNSTIGTERKANLLHATVIEGQFIQPTLQFSEKKLQFKYQWEKNVPFMPISKTLDITCACPLPVNFTLKCQAPFTVNQDQIQLNPGKSAQIRVDFDPAFKSDRKSGELEGKLVLSHHDHPHKDIIDLVGIVNFPNLSLDTNLINFGSILNDTTKKMVMTMKNVSEMSLSYEWTFVTEDVQQGTQQILPINEIFDILPLSGILDPNGEEQVEFVYNAVGGQRFKTQALCHVDGGPDYEITLSGDSSLLQYQMSTSLIELGDIRFCEWVSREFSLENIGKVTFEFKINLQYVKKKGFVDVQPLVGKILGGEKQKITVKVSPVLPAEFKEIIMVQIGYFEPQPITIIGKGVYPSLVAQLPRQENQLFLSKFEAELAKRKLDLEAQIKRAQLLSKTQNQKIQVKSLEQVQLEVERDIDRFVFCEQVKKNVLEKQEDRLGSRDQKDRFYDKIILATYICDFGNVVLNSVRSKQIVIHNMGQLSIEFVLDGKYFKAQGYNITPERVASLPAGDHITLNVQYQTKKNMGFGPTKTVVPIEVKKGPRFSLELLANITIPQIVIENSPEGIIDFGKVLIGQKKIFYMRLTNDKEIDCEWSQSTRQELAAGDKKEEPRFVLVPNNGCIHPGDKQIVEVHFTPLVERNYSQKFTLIIKENATPFVLNVKGIGSAINLQFNPIQLNIGPILPYDGFSHAILEIKNPSEFDTELFSLDFDNQYMLDDEMVATYPHLEHQEFLLMPVRQPGEPIWSDFAKAHARNKRKEQVMAKLHEQQLENREQLQKELDDIIFQENQIKVEYPKKVADDVLKHIIIFGQPKCGKTTLADYLEIHQKRKKVNLNELLDWNQENQTVAYQQYEKFVAERQNELQFVQAERDKLLKKAGKKSKDLEDKWGPVPIHIYEYINEENLTALLKARLAHGDCAAGAIFDNLQSKYWPNELFLLKCLMDTKANLQLLIIKEQLDKYGYEICKQIEWEGMQKLAEDENKKKEEIVELVPPTSKDKSTKAAKKTAKEAKKLEKPTIQQLPIQQQSRQKSRPKTNQSKKSGLDPNLYEVTYPPIFEDELLKTNFIDMANKLQSLMKNEFKEKIEIPAKIHDPVFDEGKKEEKPKPAKKGDKIPEPEEPKIELIDYTYLQQAQRICTEIPLHFNVPQLLQTGIELVPAPIYPNPNSLPIPEPIYYQIVHRKKDPLNSSIQQNSARKNTEPNQAPQTGMQIANQTMKYFSILTPKEMYAKDPKEATNTQQKTQQQEIENLPADTEDQQQLHDQNPEDPEQQNQQQNLLNKPATPGVKARANVTSRSMANVSKRNTLQKAQEIQIPLEQKYNFKQEDLNKNQYRWVIPGGKTLVLVVQFFTKTTGNFDGKLNFDNFFSIKKLLEEVKGVADFPTLSSLPKQLFWQVRKGRPSAAPESYLSKTYVANEQTFDFGPLLIGKSDKVANRSINSTTFRLANCGKFDADIQLSLLSQVQENNEMKKGIFSLDLENAKIALSSVPLELRVWCFPDKPQKFRDDLIVQIKDNPLPLIIPISCIGCRPTIDLLDSELKFERLLLNQAAAKTVTIKNTGMINAKWKLTGIENLEEEFQVINTFGELGPTQEAKIDVRFKAIKERKMNLKVYLEVEDVENMNIKQDPKLLNVDAEAFNITVDVKYPNAENILDFGSVKVGDYKDQILQVKNIGLYQVKCKVQLKKKLFKDLFKVEPVETELNPNQSKDILVRFCGIKELKMRTTNDTTDMFIEILEGQTGELFKPVPINVQFNSVYSKYGVNPVKNINFGPIQFNESKSRHLEIKNEGQFEFNFTIFDFANEEFRKQLLENQEKEKQEKQTLMQTMPSQLAPVDPKKGPKKDDKKAADKKAGKPGKNDPPPGQLKIGQWTIMPCLGTIAPDSSCTVEITFSGQGQKNYEQTLAIDVTNRNPDDQPNGIVYEVLSESCIPGLSISNYESIFEEQVVLQSQVNNLSNLINSNVFFIEEKVFSFGTLVPSKVPDGVVERFKLTNPNKIPCNVKLDARRRPNYPNDNFAFEVQPKQIKIAPHESIYIKVAFKPTIMAQYYGVFEAIVENGEQSPKTWKLLFDLRGEGALPTLKLEKPKDYIDERTPVVKFGRVRLGKTATLPIMLKNDGQIPATVKWDLSAMNEHFRFLDQNTFSLTPKTTATFNVEFCPKDVGLKQHYFIMQTLLNPYEITKIAVTGEAFQEDIVFENIDEEVQFGDCVINMEQKIQFFLKNNGTNPIRFQWNTQGCEDFNFVPRQGHLGPKEQKSISLTFKSNKSVTHKSLALACETKQIVKKTNTEWDDSMASTKYVTLTEYNWIMKRREEEETKRLAEEASQKKGAKKTDKKGGKVEQLQAPAPEVGEEANIPISEPLPEPEYQGIDKTDKSMPMKVNAIADFTKYEVESRQVNFKETLMYTTRVHTLKLKNTSLIAMNYQCKIVSAETGTIDPGYFYVYPKSGKISSQSDEQFTIKFSPTEVEETNERLLVISIDNLDPNQEKLIIELDGQADRPICHFELPPNSYRDKKPDLEAKYNVIEFESMGCKVKNTKRFYVVNPTSVGYEYEWKRVEDEKNMHSNYFKCVTYRGIVLSGKKAEIIFEYSPDTIGQHESYWTFEIPQEHIIQHFLVTGTVVEPNVIFNVGKVNFGPLLVQGKNKEVVILKNLEDVPLSFQFDRDSFYNPDYGDSLTISPLQGVIKALGDFPIEIQFAPKVEREYNYNLLCHVKRRSRPVTLNVKGIGYILHNNVYLNGLTISNPITQVELGDIYINEKQTKTITVENMGDFNFDFSIRKQAQLQNVIITPENGTVKTNEKFNIEIKFQPTQPQRLNSQVQLCISSGPTYNFQLLGSAKKPAVEFSFLSFDFGPCFVLKQPLPITKMLELRNRDVQAMAIEAIYEKKPYFNVQLPSGQVLLPIQIETNKDKKGMIHTKELNVLQIPITFTPREQIKYDESVIFDINGLQKVEIRFTGEGVPLKLDLLKTENQLVDFGVFGVGQIGSEVISLVNNSQKLITLIFEKSMLQELKSKNFLKIRPKKEFIINPRERKEITITFKPQHRLHQFKTDVFYKIVENNEIRKLLTAQGACHGIELKLMEDTVGFGAVVINSRLTKTVQLSNLGDVAAKFQWDNQFCKNYFTISPLQGTLPAHEDIHFTVTFHPNAIDNDIRFDKVKCQIQNSDPLYLNLLGKCIEQPKEQIQEVRFETVVRTPQTKKVTIKNTTAKPWKVKASVTALLPQFREYFEGKEYAEIPANSSADYEVIYKPLTMTANPQLVGVNVQEVHEGSLFFPLPDGQALLYNLFGKSLPPLPQNLDCSVKAKKNTTQVLSVKNWLKSNQRFEVSWTLEPEDPSIILNGANTFEVSGDGMKDYKLTIYGLKQAQNKVTVSFKNATTQEFVFFKLNLTIQPPDQLAKIELTSIVREIVTKLITIENPLNQAIEFKKDQLVADADSVSFNPPQFIIPPKSEFGIEIAYRPLIVQDIQSKISIKSPQLGEFVYPIKLQGVGQNVSRSLYFKAPLGSEMVLPFKFTNFTKKPTAYSCYATKLGPNGKPLQVNIDPKAKGAPAQTTDFICEQVQFQAPAAENSDGVECQVSVKYEPSGLNESRGILIVQSPDGGEYQCLLIGQGITPQPKGPFKLGGGKPPAIEFKNPFFEAQEFTIRIDNPAFTCSAKSPVKIDGKKVLSLTVTYKAVPNSSNNGRLIISCGDLPQWVFYLSGE